MIALNSLLEGKAWSYEIKSQGNLSGEQNQNLIKEFHPLTGLKPFTMSPQQDFKIALDKSTVYISVFFSSVGFIIVVIPHLLHYCVLGIYVLEWGQSAEVMEKIFCLFSYSSWTGSHIQK